MTPMNFKEIPFSQCGLIKGTVMKIEKALINDRLPISKVS